MKLSVGFGMTFQEFEVPNNQIIDILKANEIKIGLKDEEEVKRSLENPIGTERLKDIVKPGEKIVIITSDITRPVPSYKIIPSILNELYEIGINKKDIIIVFALGSHREHTEEEMIQLVGERVYHEVKCIDSNTGDCIRLGITEGGTPIDIFRVVAEADRRICVGNIEYHYFAGYSGGSKAVMPGVSTLNAIQANHSKMVHEDSRVGKLIGNPVRDDLNEAIEHCYIDFIVNVVLNEDKEIIYSVAGHFIEAHRVGCEFLDSIYKKELEEKADIVIVSQGGAPKDINLYQTQKALENAKYAVKDRGIIILVGSCKEGFGNKTFEEWMTQAKSPDDLITRINNEFVLGGHKAAAIAYVLKKSKIYMVSEMDFDIVQKIFMKPYKTVQEAYDDAVKILGENIRVLIMPFGGSTLPYINE